MRRPISIVAAGGAAALAVLTAASCGDPYAASPPAQQQAKTEVEAPSVPVQTAAANGFGDAITWEPLDAGLARAKAQNKPVMLVAHADWCSSCKRLKSEFFDEALAQLSRRFVMVNVEIDTDPRAKQAPYVPDGGYVPRILFVQAQTGAVDTTLKNSKRSKDFFYYSAAADVVAAMHKALNRHERT